jgi:DNA segregation ATPase FtsK/SpoIIIE, S-DNA-T family
MFNYGNFKLFLVKILSGISLIIFSSFLIISFLTFNLNDPGIGKFNANVEISNFFGYFGAISSSFLLVFLGSFSIIIVFFIFFSGTILVFGLEVKKLLIKFFLINISVLCINFSLTLSGFISIKKGLLSDFLVSILGYYLPLFINEPIYKYLLISLLLITSLLFSIYCFSIKINFFKYILYKIYSSFLFIFSKPFHAWKFINKKNTSKNKEKNEPTISKKTKVFRNPVKLTKKDNSKSKQENEFIFNLPNINYLIQSKTKNSDKKELDNHNKKNVEKLEKVLSEYGVDGKVTGFRTGPIVTLYEFIPNAGIKASKIIGLSDDIARAMSSVSARISSQPGKTSLGIEIPNLKRENVMFGDLVENKRFEDLDNSLTLALGKDISGQTVFADLEKMPHLLIAGTTGSGKSVGINTIIMSILYRFKPDECKLILIDPKMLELSIYENIPHLLTPVVTNPNKAVFALKWVVREMENRYKLMSTLNVKNINSYNEKSKKILSSGKKFYRQVQTGIDNETKQPILEKREIPLEKMPFIVVVIDEMADLMMVAGKEVENLVQRLAQMARASGIHLVTATQRPSVDVITGTIKANFPSRISYKVASKFDSRTIINEMGAEQLLGSGDMLFLENGANLKRLHGGFISETEIENIVNSIKEQATFDQTKEITMEEKIDDGEMAFKFDDGEVDALYTKAVNIIIEQQRVSTSYIQRYLQIGYNRAARIVEKMEEEGIISEANNAGKRQVLRKN